MSSVRVKICGITRPKDAESALIAGADAIGLVFYGPSTRHLDDLGLAREIAEAAGPFVNVVGLVVNPEAAMVDALLKAVPINLLQFHGDESAAFCEQFAQPYLKAIRMREGIDLDSEMATFGSAQGILLDAYKKGIPGGTGEHFDWQRVPHDSNKPIVLAGGLHSGNVSEAIRVSRPYAVDVSGGVEHEHHAGLKDPQKIADFIAAARSTRLE